MMTVRMFWFLMGTSMAPGMVLCWIITVLGMPGWFCAVVLMIGVDVGMMMVGMTISLVWIKVLVVLVLSMVQVRASSTFSRLCNRASF